MEKESTPSAVEEKLRFTPPAESHWTSILNGVGNAIMLGMVPFAGFELWKQIQDKNISNKKPLTLAFVTVATSAVGAIYGYREAQKLKEYRQSINDELANLRTEVNARKNWTQKTQEQPTVKEETAAR